MVGVDVVVGVVVTIDKQKKHSLSWCFWSSYVVISPIPMLQAWVFRVREGLEMDTVSRIVRLPIASRDEQVYVCLCAGVCWCVLVCLCGHVLGA